MPRAAHTGANKPGGGDAQTHMCRAAITDGNAFFPAATAICQSRQEHTRQSLQQTSARLTARWRWSPAALAVTSRAVTLHVRFRSPGRRESFRAPPPAPAGDTHRCTLLHGRVCTPTCGAGTPARGAGAARRGRFAQRRLNYVHVLRRVSAGGERGLAAAADPLLTRRSIMVSCTGLRTEAHSATRSAK